MYATPFQTLIILILETFIMASIDKYFHLSDPQSLSDTELDPATFIGPEEYVSEEISAGTAWLEFFGYVFAVVIGLVFAVYVFVFVRSLVLCALSALSALKASVSARVKKAFGDFLEYVSRGVFALKASVSARVKKVFRDFSGYVSRVVLGEYSEEKPAEVKEEKVDMSISAVAYRTWAAEDAALAKLKKEDPDAYRRLITPEVKPRNPRAVARSIQLNNDPQLKRMECMAKWKEQHITIGNLRQSRNWKAPKVEEEEEEEEWWALI